MSKRNRNTVTRQLVVFLATLALFAASLPHDTRAAEAFAEPANEDSIVTEEEVLTSEPEAVALFEEGWVAGETSTQKLEINNGLSTLTQKADGTTKQLTPSLIAKDGGIAADGTVYIVYDVTYSLWAYNYEVQNGVGDLVPIVSSKYPTSSGDTSISTLTFDSDGLITGFNTDSGTQDLFTVDEFKARAAVTGQLPKSEDGSGDNSSGDNGSGNGGNGSGSGSESGSGSGSGSGNGSGTTDSNDLSDPNTGNEAITTITAPTDYSVVIVNGQILYTDTYNNIKNTTIIPIEGTIANYGRDAYGTYAIRTVEGYLYLLNPAISTTPYMYSKSCTELVITDGLVTGYKLETVKQDELGASVTITTEVSVLEPRVLTSKMLHVWRVVQSEPNFYAVLDPNGNQYLSVKFSGATAIFYKQNAVGEWKTLVKKVGSNKAWGINDQGVILLLKKNGRIQTLDPVTKTLSYWTDTKKWFRFTYSKNGTLQYVYRKNGESMPLF